METKGCNMERLINIKALVEGFTQVNWSEAILALIVGIVLGYIFSKLKLPAPAPLVLAGILGIVGIWAGYLLGK